MSADGRKLGKIPAFFAAATAPATFSWKVQARTATSFVPVSRNLFSA